MQSNRIEIITVISAVKHLSLKFIYCNQLPREKILNAILK